MRKLTHRIGYVIDFNGLFFFAFIIAYVIEYLI